MRKDLIFDIGEGCKTIKTQITNLNMNYCPRGRCQGRGWVGPTATCFDKCFILFHPDISKMSNI